METYTIKADTTGLIASAIRVILMAVGLILLFLNIDDFFGSGGTFWTGFSVIIGLGLMFSAIFNINIGNINQLTLNTDFIRATESASYIRTAYWNQIDELTLTRFSIRIKYQSGTAERFRLPFLKTDEHTELRDRLQNVSKENNIQFAEKEWWKPF